MSSVVDVKYQPSMALKEHMLAGNAVSLIEAMLLFGVKSPNRTLTNFKREGFVVQSRNVPMAKIIRRINQHVDCSIPDDLPYEEIDMMEYWLTQ